MYNPLDIAKVIVEGGKTIANKLWMDKGEKEQLAFTKEQFVENIKLAVSKMKQDGALKAMAMRFSEYQAQRDYANQQFGSVEALKGMGFFGKVVVFGRASIRWVITGGFSYMTYDILQAILPAIKAKLASGGTLTVVEFMVLALVIGVPVFYVCGVSVEKWLKIRNI